MPTGVGLTTFKLNRQSQLENHYVVGSGVGGKSMFARRALRNRASNNAQGEPCCMSNKNTSIIPCGNLKSRFNTNYTGKFLVTYKDCPGNTIIINLINGVLYSPTTRLDSYGNINIDNIGTYYFDWKNGTKQSHMYIDCNTIVWTTNYSEPCYQTIYWTEIY